MQNLGQSVTAKVSSAIGQVDTVAVENGVVDFLELLGLAGSLLSTMMDGVIKSPLPQFKVAGTSKFEISISRGVISATEAGEFSIDGYYPAGCILKVSES